MAFIGLVAAKNLSDVASAEAAWDNLGNGFSYTTGETTVSGIVVKGADILALNGINRLSTSDLLYLRGLSSNAQSRLNIIAAQVASGLILQSNALLRDSPTSSGDYTLSGNLSFASLQINGNDVQSSGASPFSGNTATAPIAVDRIAITNDFTVQNVISSGSVTSPSIGIPIEDEGYIYYLKAGQV